MKSAGPFLYREEDLLGLGGYGTVYRGHHRTNPSWKVAIKIVQKNIYQNFEREWEIHQELQTVISPNIVRVFGCYESASELKIVMEFCNSGNLADYIRRIERLNESNLRPLIKQLASAMMLLRGKNIVHRDIKPENILLDYQNGFLTFKIADFGVATVFPGDFNHMSKVYLTQIGLIVYMAPEIRLGYAYNAKVDLWSIGVVLYQCLTGSLPIYLNNDIVLDQYYNNPAFTIPIPAGLSFLLHALLSGLLRVNPQYRIDFTIFFQVNSSTFQIAYNNSIKSKKMANYSYQLTNSRITYAYHVTNVPYSVTPRASL